MVLGSKIDGGSQVVSLRVRKTIQSIREVVGNHSDADIYAVLKETNMDPNETAQKLLNQDPFHEVKRRRDRRKEAQHTGFRGIADTRKQMEQKVQLAKSYRIWDQNANRGGFTRNPVPGISQEFRIVRDNRVNQNVSRVVKQEEIKQPVPGVGKVMSGDPEKSSARGPSDRKHSVSENSHECLTSAVFKESSYGPHHSKDEKSSGMGNPSLQDRREAIVSTFRAQNVENSSQTQTLVVPNNLIGMYSSSSDPVHVPSDSRPAGKVGAIQREVGVVGIRRRTSDHSASHSSVSNSSLPISLLGKDGSSLVESSGHQTLTSKSNLLNHISTSTSNPHSMSLSRSSQNSYQNSKLHQQYLSQQKALCEAVQPIMEWKPKVSPKPNVVSSGAVGTAPASPSCADGSSISDPVGTTRTYEKLSQETNSENQHVIIPQHLQVPESERIRLTFGSFGAGFDAAKGFVSASKQSGSAERSAEEPSDSMSASVPMEDVFSAGNRDILHVQARTSPCSSSASAAESEEPLPENNGSISPQNIETYDDVGLVESNSPPFNTQEEQQPQNPPCLPSFSAYDNQSSYDVPFFRTVIEDNVHIEGSASLPEQALSFHTACSSPSSMAMAQQQQLIQQQQQQQPVAQLYPQIHIPHFPNFVPYRHLFSPVYVPPMAMPNYSSSPAYPHPSSVNSYLLMPGGNSHITASGMKYATSQYKPVPAGNPTAYGSYTNQAGFAINSPGAVGSATGLEELNRVKYKDNSLYVPNAQAETSDIWIQTPRELPSLQSAPFYNLSGQAPHAAFMPAHAGHAAFNAATPQTSHVQYPGLYQQPQPTSMVSPHHLVQQQVSPALGGSVGVGVAAPGPQVGNYQQSQFGHLNWTTNF